jgi:hypothetical protein
VDDVVAGAKLLVVVAWTADVDEAPLLLAGSWALE